MTEPRPAPIGAWSPTMETGPQKALKPTPTAPELAAHLAAKLCHDFISPASAIMSGVDLLGDPTAQDMRDDALHLISASAQKLADMLAFARVAFGASASAEAFDSEALHKLTEGVYAHVRPNLDWQVATPIIQKPGARALLNMSQIAASALPTGGIALVKADVAGDTIILTVDARGPRARLRPEVVAGLNGEPLGEGLGGHWVQAFYLHSLVAATGGRVTAEISEERVLLAATVPN